MTDMPIVGLADHVTTARLAMAVFDDDKARFDAAMADAQDRIPELIYALVCNWAKALVLDSGPYPASVRVENILIGAIEHYEEPGQPWASMTADTPTIRRIK